MQRQTGVARGAELKEDTIVIDDSEDDDVAGAQEDWEEVSVNASASQGEPKSARDCTIVCGRDQDRFFLATQILSSSLVLNKKRLSPFPSS